MNLCEPVRTVWTCANSANSVNQIWTSKPSLAEGRKDDIKNIWDTVGLEGFDLYQTTSDMDNVGRAWSYGVEKPDDDWERLEQILDMGEAEFAAIIKEAEEEDGEDEEDSSEDGEDEEGDLETGEEDE